MHSLIFEVVKQLIIEKYGENKWNELATKSEFPITLEKDFYYSDNALYDLVANASSMLSTSSEAVLELVGYYFIEYVRKSEYEKILNMSGGSLAETLQNINGLHGHMKLSFFKHIAAPTFRTTNVTSTSLRLHYIPGKPNRRSLAPLVVGLIKGLAEAHYRIPASKVNVLLLKSADKGADHDVFHVSWKKAEDKKSSTEKASITATSKNFSFGLDGESLNRVFPFHFIINKKLQIVQVGSSLQKLMKLQGEESMRNRMEIRSPKIVDTYSYKILEKFIGDLISIRIKLNNSTTSSSSPSLSLPPQYIELSTEIIKLRDRSDRSSLCFVGSPNLRSLQEAIDLGLNLSDFAVHDPAKDRLFAFDHAEDLHQKIAQISFSDKTLSSSYDDDSSLSEVSESLSIGNTSKTNPQHIQFLSPESSSTQPSSRGVCPFSSGRVNIGKQKSSEATLMTISHSVSDQLGGQINSRSAQSNDRSPPSNYFPSSVIAEIIQNDALSNFDLMRTIIEKSKTENNNELKEYILNMTKIYDYFGKINHLINQSIEWEIENYTSSSPSKKKSNSYQMFRQDTSSSSILSVYCKDKAKKIIKKLLNQLIQYLSQNNVQANDYKSIITTVNQFLNDLIASAPSWPLEVAKLIAKISRDVSDKRGLEDANNAVTSILFLRLIAPAIAFPTQFDIAPSKSLMEQQKTLLCISKIINNIVNGVTFNEQSNMAVYNSLINFKESEDKIDRFVNLLIEQSSISMSSFSRVLTIHSNLCDVKTYLSNQIDVLLDLIPAFPVVRSFVRELSLTQIRN